MKQKEGGNAMEGWWGGKSWKGWVRVESTAGGIHELMMQVEMGGAWRWMAGDDLSGVWVLGL